MKLSLSKRRKFQKLPNTYENNDIKNEIKSDKKFKDKNKIMVTDDIAILQKCSIEEISKYLINLGKNKKFPDITVRQ